MTRRMMMGTRTKTADDGISGYVTNGLLFWIDGIYNTQNGHDPTSAKWVDLSGNGYDPIYVADSIIKDKSFNTNNKSLSLSKEFTAGENDKIRFAEVVYSLQTSSAGLIYSFNNNVGGSMYHRANGNLSFYKGTNASSRVSIPLTLDGKPHYYNSALKKDGQTVQNASDQTGWSAYIQQIFGYPDKYVMQGDIYALRIYDRVLSESEQQQNWLEDKRRFGIDI